MGSELNATGHCEGADSIDQDKPLLTIGVPVYNGERFLAQCLDSLLSQTFRDYILVISDNASTDGTAAICQRYVESDSRLRYHRNDTNVGMYGNANFLLRSAQTRYVKLANADDFWAPTMLSDAVEAMERDPSLVMCHPRAVFVDQDRREIRRYESPLHLMDDDPVVRFTSVLKELGFIIQLMGVIRTQVVRSTLPLMSQPGADCVFLAELSLHGKILEIPAYQYFRRFHEESSSWDRTSEAHQVKRVLGEGARRIWLAGWKYHLGLVRRLIHSPLEFEPKLKLLLLLSRRIVWDRSVLCRELWQLLRPVRASKPSNELK